MYLRFQLVHLRSQLAYEADFWIGVVGVALTHGVGIVFVWALFLNVPDVAGWGVWEVALLYALSVIPRGLAELLCDGQWGLRLLVNRGELDRLLLRPISPALQVITHFASIHGLGSVLLGAAVVSRAAAELGLRWGPGAWLLLLVALASGTVVMGALNFATNCSGFWEPSSNSAFPFLAQNLAEFAKFPITLYDRLVRGIISWVVPFACVSYYPALLLLGRPEARPWMAAAPPLAALAMTLVAALVWRLGLARYQGAGH